MKIYNFVFKGHNYTSQDRASNQGICPHCCCRAPDNFMFDAKRNKDLFIGYYKVDKINCIACFECPECFEKFYYHQSKIYVFVE